MTVPSSGSESPQWRPSRRDALRLALLGGAALALPRTHGTVSALTGAPRMPTSALPAPFTVPFVRPVSAVPVRTDATTDYFRITMKESVQELLPGMRTPVWGYDGLVPGPTIDAVQGRRTVVRFVNELPARHPTLGYTPWTSTHLHGQGSRPQYDGYASDVTNPGQFKDYVYPNWQNARPLWYHDHGLHHTAENVEMGLAGLYRLTDAHEPTLGLPKGEHEVPLVVFDRTFATDGSLVLDRNDDSGMYGDVVLVNGRPWPVMKVKRRKYRFRILNASTSRTYEWYLLDGGPMTVIGTDAGLMPAPQVVTRLRHGNAERYDVVIDFARYRAGTRVVLRNRSPKNNIDYANVDKVMAFDVVRDSFDRRDNTVPSVLNPDQPAMTAVEADATAVRRLDFRRANSQWTINGTTWEDVVASGFTKVLASPRVDDTEIWELRNDSGGWHHPVHVHFVDFRVLSRNGAPPKPYEAGPKDVVYLGENETVRVLVRFDRGRGRYMIHCHNLVHEDHDMMGQFTIENPDVEEESPFAAPPLWLPDGDL